MSSYVQGARISFWVTKFSNLYLISFLKHLQLMLRVFISSKYMCRYIQLQDSQEVQVNQGVSC